MERFTREQVSALSGRSDAAIIIDNVVYSVAAFLDDHPGGAEILLDNAGKDASKCFHDVGHSEDAKNWRERFKIGEVVDEDKWEVIRPARNTGGDEDDPITLSGLLNVWAPPLLMGAIAVYAYAYLF